MTSPPDTPPGSDRIPPDVAEPSPAEALKQAVRAIAGLRDYVFFYIRTRIDLALLSVRNLLAFAAILLTGLLVTAALLVTSVVLLCRGIAETLAVAFNGRVWLADLVTAIVLLILVMGGGYAMLAHVSNTWKERTVRIYSRLKSRQRSAHGTDVDQQANR